MTNGGELINSFKGTPKDITSTIENQQKQISTLQNETLRLNNQIIDNQKECTNKIIEREKSFSVEIQRIINLSKRQHINEMYILDTVQSVVSPRPIIINDDIIIKELEKLKISLQKK
jgi:predicted HicB family RNase H-like nuclease